MNNTVTITIKQFENFITRDLDSFTGIAKLQAAFDINKRYKIIDKKYTLANITLIFETPEAKTWFLLNL